MVSPFPPVARAASRVGLILLAPDGSPRLRTAALAALGSRCRPIVVVAEHADTALADLPVVGVAPTDRSPGGIVRAGLDALERHRLSGVVIARTDHPLLGAALYDTLVARHCATGRPIAAALCNGRTGLPAYFSAPLFPALRTLPFDQDCRTLLRANPALVATVACPEADWEMEMPDSRRRPATTRADLRPTLALSR